MNARQEACKLTIKALEQRQNGEYIIRDMVIDHIALHPSVTPKQPCETIHGSTFGGVSWGGTYKPQLYKAESEE